jgi:hypothetical protein
MPPSDIAKKSHFDHFDTKAEMHLLLFGFAGRFRLFGNVVRDALLAIDTTCASLDRFRHEPRPNSDLF